MRTTINMNDDLLRLAKLRAAETSRTLTSVIEEAVRLALQDGPRPSDLHSVQLPTSGTGGLLPGVTLDDTSALIDRMENRD